MGRHRCYDAIYRAALVASLLLPASATAQSADDDHEFRDAYPQCFKLFPDGKSSENAACREILVRNPYTSYSDDELAKAVQEQLQPRKESEVSQQRSEEDSNEDIMKRAYPQCYSLYQAGTAERDACIEVIARSPHASWSDESVRESVKLEIARRQEEKAEAEKRRVREQRQQAERNARKRREQARRNAELSRKPLGWVLEGWELSGFGTVFIATLTIQNNSKERLADFRVACMTYGNSGTALSTPTGVLYEALRPGQRGTFRINLGFVHSQSAKANCAVYSH